MDMFKYKNFIEKNKFLWCIVHFFRRLLYFFSKIIFGFTCLIIFIITYEFGMHKKVTKRKILRIRRLTKFKLWLWKNFKWFICFIHDDKYYRNLEKRFGKRKKIFNVSSF